MVKVEIDLERRVTDCSQCPLRNSLTWGCGKVTPENYNGAVIYRKHPLKCKLKYKRNGKGI